MTEEIKRAVADGDSSLDWTTMATTPQVVTDMLPLVLLLVTAGAYVGAVVLFLTQRRAGLKADAA